MSYGPPPPGGSYGQPPPPGGSYGQPPPPAGPYGGYQQPPPSGGYGAPPPQQQQYPPSFGQQSAPTALTGPDVKLTIYPYLTPMQMINIASTFMAFDEDKSGAINKNEMIHCLNSNGINADPATVSQQVDRMDTDHDGMVSWTEYFKFMSEVFQNSPSGNYQPR